MSDHSFQSQLNDAYVDVAPYTDWDGNVGFTARFGRMGMAILLAPDDAEMFASLLTKRAAEGRAVAAGDPPLRYWQKVGAKLRRREGR